MLHLLGSGGLFGRRLQQGFLEGFFTMLEDMEWECTSAPLPNPEDRGHISVRLSDMACSSPSESDMADGRTCP